MDAYEQSRLDFLKKLGLTIGAAVVTPALNLAFTIKEKAEEFALNDEQSEFMQHYEKWMDEFIPVIRRQKVDHEDYENNKKIVELSEQAKKWQPQLINYMKDDNFARHYLIISERMTHEI